MELTTVVLAYFPPQRVVVALTSLARLRSLRDRCNCLQYTGSGTVYICRRTSCFQLQTYGNLESKECTCNCVLSFGSEWTYSTNVPMENGPLKQTLVFLCGYKSASYHLEVLNFQVYAAINLSEMGNHY